MGMMISKIQFKDFSLHPLIRGDFKYINFKKNIEDNYTVSIKIKDAIISYFKGFAFKGSDFLNKGDIHVIKGDMFNSDFTINYEGSHFLSEEFYEDQRYSQFIILKDDIIVSLVGSIGKIAIVNNDYKSLLNQNNIALRLNTDIYDLKLFSYLLRGKIKKMVENVYKNSGYSFLAIDDLFETKLPCISIKDQNVISNQLSSIENEIVKLQRLKQKKTDLINQVFFEEFKITSSDIILIDKLVHLKVELSNVSFRNNNLRDSFRWNKMQYIQTYLYKDIDCIKLLGNFITETKNGWSPLSVDGGDGIPVLGQEHFSFDGVLKISPSKFTEETRNNIEDYFIQTGDFFVSRGNTVDLVALASVVEEDINQDIIFPDLYIKIQFDEKRIDKKYLALLFNSFFGRLYFKYASKGKNQTMVKISSSELYDFYLPIPEIEIQRKLVKKVEAQINAQSILDKEIEKNMDEINSIIEEAIQN